MKIQVDGQEVFELADWEKTVIKNDIPEEIFEDDMKRRLTYSLKHKAERCFERLHAQWMPILRDDPSVESVPTDKAAFVDLIMSRPEYKSRSARDADERERG